MDLRQFRERLEQLFKNYPDVLEILPNFFSDQTDLQIAPPIQSNAPAPKPPKPAKQTAKEASSKKQAQAP